MSASLQQYFNEAEAVCQVLSEFVNEYDPEASYILEEETFTAIWQAIELLARALTYISAQVNAEAARTALLLPAPVEQKGPGLILPGGGLVP